MRSPAERAVVVQVSVPADTLTGGDQPGEVPGYGPIPANTARDLTGTTAGAPGSSWPVKVRCQGLVYHPESGRLLGLSNLLTPTPTPSTRRDGVRVRWLADGGDAGGYEHPPVTERLITARDGTCRAPGCTRPAAGRDCDHVVPWPKRPTTVENACCLCRRHHRPKTHAPGWTTSIDGTGRLTWTTPTGHTLSTDPTDYRPYRLPDGPTGYEVDPPPF